MYILLAVVAIVATASAAFLHILFPRRVSDGPIISEKTLASDRWVIRRRRQTVLGAVALLALVWLGVVMTMMSYIEEWSNYHLWHFGGLMFYFVLHVIFIKYLTDRINAEALNLLPRPSVTINPDSEENSTKGSASER
ncbi:MAG: hypothetical protein F4Z66_13440 [Gammaproteobacteria bacterium]|nr:hypothetical protein [Gammaproteobacteria bacterium]